MSGLFGTIVEHGTLSAGGFLLATAVSLGIGLFIAFMYSRLNRCTNSMALTIIMIPAIVQLVIMMVNGNIGVGLAVAGAFTLVRYRSIPGKGQEMTVIFLAMATGLITGMGYLGLAAVFTLAMSLIFMLYNKLDLGASASADRYKTLRIVVPEDLDYTGVFEDVFSEYTSFCDLVQVKTTNMGSMFKLTYDVKLKDPAREKEMIDRIRCRNGNLEVNVSRQGTSPTEL